MDLVASLQTVWILTLVSTPEVAIRLLAPLQQVCHLTVIFTVKLHGVVDMRLVTNTC